MAINLALHLMDSGCSPELKQTPIDQVITDSNLSWGCFFLLCLLVVSPKQAPCGCALALLIYPYKMLSNVAWVQVS